MILNFFSVYLGGLHFHQGLVHKSLAFFKTQPLISKNTGSPVKTVHGVKGRVSGFFKIFFRVWFAGKNILLGRFKIFLILVFSKHSFSNQAEPGSSQITSSLFFSKNKFSFVSKHRRGSKYFLPGSRVEKYFF